MFLISRNNFLKTFLLKSFIIILLLTGISTNAAQNNQVKILTLLQNNEKQLQTLLARVEYLQDNYAVLVNHINDLKTEVAREKQKNSNLQNEINSIKTQMNADRKQVQKSLDNVVDKVAQETTKAINSAVKTTNTQQIKSTNSQNEPSASGEFHEYKVQPGATLSAIAKAYDVSVSSIRSANNLRGDMIRAGQILYIPKN